MKKILFIAIFSMGIFITSSYADGLTLFYTETSAQNHCPNDEVVWLNLPTGEYGITKALVGTVQPKMGHMFANKKLPYLAIDKA